MEENYIIEKISEQLNYCNYFFAKNIMRCNPKIYDNFDCLTPYLCLDMEKKINSGELKVTIDQVGDCPIISLDDYVNFKLLYENMIEVDDESRMGFGEAFHQYLDDSSSKGCYENDWIPKKEIFGNGYILFFYFCKFNCEYIWKNDVDIEAYYKNLSKEGKWRELIKKCKEKYNNRTKPLEKGVLEATKTILVSGGDPEENLKQIKSYLPYYGLGIAGFLTAFMLFLRMTKYYFEMGKFTFKAFLYILVFTGFSKYFGVDYKKFYKKIMNLFKKI